jgi:sugar O-acyltransferase (sialic acid O-acetyltransferase NeuD family)
MRDLVIIGARSHARELFDAVAAVNEQVPTWNFRGFVGHGVVQPDRIAPLGSIIGDIGDDTTWSDLPPTTTSYVIGIGSPLDREAIDQTMTARGYTAATIVHPTAVIGSQVSLGEGCYVAALAAVMANAVLGRHVHINVRANVHHDCRVGDWSIVNPASVLTGNVTLGVGVDVGAAATFIPGVVVRDRSVIGAGTIVIRDVPAHAKVVGNPGRLLPRRN